MRIRGLLMFLMALIGLLILSLSASGVAMMEGALQTPRPTPTAAPLPPGYETAPPRDPEAAEKPDLIVESIEVFPSAPYVNEPATVSVAIKNVGTVDVDDTNNFFLDLYINPTTNDLRGIPGDYWWGVQGYQMKVGQRVVFAIELTDTFTDTLSYNLWAQVDTPFLPDPSYPFGHVVESNEDNNVLGPEYVTVRTHHAWVQKDHVDYFTNMASTLDVVPVVGTVGIVTNTPGLEINGDSALALGVFDEPPQTTWGQSSGIPPGDEDYNMLSPDIQLNEDPTYDQQYPYVSATSLDPDTDLVVAVWEDGRNGPTYGRDIYLRWSGDNGEEGSWSGEVQVNETYMGHDAGDQKHPAVAVSPNGTIVVAWQDHRGGNFDIYVQAFIYDDVDGLIPCHSNGDCSTECDPTVEECNFRVDTGAFDQDQILPDIAVDEVNNFYIAWQDQRNGNDDIFAVRSYTSTVPCPTSRAELPFLPEVDVEPSAVLAPDYLCWGGDTRIHDDPSRTKQASPAISAVHGLKILDLEHEIHPRTPPLPPLLVVTRIISEPTTYVVVTWEDWREGDPDIYLTYSDDLGETFVIDERLNEDKGPNSSNGVKQQGPDVAANQWMKQISLTKPTEYGLAEGEVDVPVTTMHIVWQDFRNSTPPTSNNDPDIYCHRITVEPEGEFPWPIIFKHEGQQKVNEDDARAWQTGPVWQYEPSVAATGSGLTLEESEGYNAYVVWSDGRNYGGEFQNIDVYFRLYSNVGQPTTFVGGNNIVVNDGARLHGFDDTDPFYDGYRLDMPPHARQRSASIASTLVAEWPTIFGGYLYVVWDDDRVTAPYPDRNVYVSRSNLLFGGHRREFGGPGPGQDVRYGSGAFVSEVFDSGSYKTTWYVVDWHAVTDNGTYITLQTRLGNSRDEVLASDWYPKRFPYPDDAVSKGAPLQGYDAPGQHIEDVVGDYWPQARYIQYRVNFWARDTAEAPELTVLYTPFLFDVILHYERPSKIFLPVIFRDFQ